MTEPLLYDRKTAAALLGISVPTLDNLTRRREGPRPNRVGSRVLFSRDELLKFVSATVAA